MRPIDVVCHTHWDREWYLPFEAFQDRLVEVMDEVLDLVGGPYPHFHLDGQTALVDDYLQRRPERAGEVAAHIAAGRLSCGPWVTLADTFSVSGESIVRNLQDGMARARTLGGCCPVAYLPDQFGHASQLPQILAREGFEWAVVWRGVPAAVTRTSFRWRSPDGSEVSALYLPFGYGQGKDLPADPAQLAARLGAEMHRSEPFLAPDEPLLLMAGDDHQRPCAALPDLLRAAGGAGRQARITSLREHVAARTRPVQEVVGELRSAARANLLPNTYSVRVHQKLARARAEHLLERYAEPLAAVVLADDYPEAELGRAWHLLHLNAAHDSVCGCSTDEVARAVDSRTAAAAALAEDVAARALARLACGHRAPGVLAFNPSPFPRAGIDGLGWAVTETPAPPRPVPATSDGTWARWRLPAGEIALAVEDQGDAGDLYTFEPAGEPIRLRPTVTPDGSAIFACDGVEVGLQGWLDPGNPTVLRVAAQVSNRRPDHRLRVLLALPQEAATTRAGSPFDVVVRPRRGEGGPSEPGAACWPARGFALAGGAGLLSEGVFEYELGDGVLAGTLLRCTGTISRPYALTSRRIPAGPAVATPGAQMLGDHVIPFGVVARDPGEDIVRVWERFALPLRVAPLSPGPPAPASGARPIDVEAPALSSVRRRGDGLEVRIYQPFDRTARARVGGRIVELGPHEIATVRLP